MSEREDRVTSHRRKHKELFKDQKKAWDDLLAERERSRKLVDALLRIADVGDSYEPMHWKEHLAQKAIAEYEEAGRE